MISSHVMYYRSAAEQDLANVNGQRLYQEAYDLVHKVTAKLSNHTRSRLCLAEMLLLTPTPSLALPHLEHVRAIDPKNVQCTYLLGEHCIKAKNFLEAKRLLLEVYQADPTHSQALVRIAMISEEEGDISQCIAFLSAAVNAAPDQLFRLHLADLLQATNKPDQAIAHYREVVRYHPEHSSAMLSLAIALRQRNPHEADGLFQLLIMNNPQDLPAMKEYARLLQMTGLRPQKLSELYRLISMLDPSYNPSFFAGNGSRTFYYSFSHTLSFRYQRRGRVDTEAHTR
jgi:tetratricopeptide (TPR) repeat protein